MPRPNNRESILVNRLDGDKATALIRSKTAPNLAPDTVAEDMVVINTPKGLTTVCTEGVGWFVNDDGEYLLGAFIGYAETSYMITEDELKSCILGEMVDLKDFINVFGDRLETNFTIWYNQARNTPQDIMSVGAGNLVSTN
jgi:hypothetical protein